MAKKLPRKPVPKLRWRRTRIGDWRAAVNLTQQQVADALTAAGVPLDRVSIGRIEGGQQMATIAALEAMAALFKTDVDSMLNYTPDQAKEFREFRQLDREAQSVILRMARAAREGSQ